ncbi:precorrin-6Y C5,15-methyltransferase (decarboxylating) subunit CbiT [Micropruina sp.]|uniref:precorrin-6Y C5,15-methyltransferase (decarboxylating) subunit CbiT n=1 Tax=Micropruina sp. TaxID=2737536 RepID=UPI0039E236DB
MTGQLTAGLPDDAFASDGLLTKRVLRASALAALAPVGDELLWDLGAGTGSIGIEWCRLSRGNRAIAVERNAERAERIRANVASHAVNDQVRIVERDIAAALGVLPDPDAVFVGGGVDEAVLRHCWGVLRRGGRLVVHSVTADSDAVLLGAYRSWGGELSRVAVETAEPIGRFTGFRPARTVTAWAVVRG